MSISIAESKIWMAKDKYFLFPRRDEFLLRPISPNLTTLVIYFRPLGDVNDNEKCEN